MIRVQGSNCHLKHANIVPMEMKYLPAKDRLFLPKVSIFCIFGAVSFKNGTFCFDDTRGDSPVLKHFYFIYKFLIIRLSLQNIFYL